MSKNHRELSDYVMNGVRYKTIEKTKNEKRIWVACKPIDNKTSVIAVHLVDRPQDAGWESHIEEIYPNKFISQRTPATSSGSICFQAGNFIISKELNAQVYLFPIDSSNPNYPVRNLNYEGNLNNSSTIVGNVDASTWIGYATTTSGTISLI